MIDRRVRYTVKPILEDVQRAPYADHVSTFQIIVERRDHLDAHGGPVWVLWQPPFPQGSGESSIWAKKLVRALCMDFREQGDNDGRTGIGADFYPHLVSLDVDEGIIEVEIRRMYTG